MAQLSTDTLIYTQIISKVQEFLIKFSQNKNSSTEDFDKEYKNLLNEIQTKIGRPLTDITLFNKGEIPSSEKFNLFSTSISKDLNNIMSQFETLVANYVNSFNKINNEIETEKNLLKRIKSKVDTLSLYSGSSATNIVYLGDTFNNLDYVNTSKIRPGLIPDVSDGTASLAKKNIKKIPAKIKVVNQNYNNEQSKEISYIDISNGIKGNNHLFYKQLDGSPYIFEKDSDKLRSNELAMLDESPATYFEYEAISFSGLSNRQEYEFQYEVPGNNGSKNYINWASFDKAKPLKLTIEIDISNNNGEYINYISIMPFFGYDNIDSVRNIKISSIKLYEEKQNKIFNLVQDSHNVYIGSDISAPSLSTKNSYFYNKGVFRFNKTKANKIYITFEQSIFNPVTIKHAYWTPYSVEEVNKPSRVSWRGQDRFNPLAIYSPNDNFTSEDVSWDRSVVVPSINSVNSIKTSTKKILPATIKYLEKKESKFKVIKFISNNETYYFNSSRRTSDGILINLFTKNIDNASKYSLSTNYLETDRQALVDNASLNFVIGDNQSPNEKFESSKIKLISVSGSSNSLTFVTQGSHNLQLNDKVFINTSSDLSNITKAEYTVSQIINPTSFKVSTSTNISLSLTSLSFSYASRSELVLIDQNITIEEVNQRVNEQKIQNLFLERNFEFLKVDRASIAIRDVFVGMETYTNAAEIVSKPFPIYGKLDLVSLQVEDYQPVELNSNNERIGSSSITYYISVDGGSKWIEISPIERSFSGKPEVIAFNQNLSNSAMLPQIAYFNSPEVPEQIKTIILKAVIKKDTLVTSTPIIYSYKLAMKVV